MLNNRFLLKTLLSLGISLFLIALIGVSCFDEDPAQSDVPTGSAEVTITLGEVGSLAKQAAIELDTLFIALEADGAIFVGTLPGPPPPRYSVHFSIHIGTVTYQETG